MIEQLVKIAENCVRAAELLKHSPGKDPGIQNLINENSWRIKELEIYSSGLVENIEQTKKLNKS